MLTLIIESDARRRTGKADSNIELHLPSPQSDLAPQTIQDPYIFDVLTHDRSFHERLLETQLVHHLIGFLLEFGQGFMDSSLGKSGIWLSASIRVRDKGIRVYLVMGASDALAYFKLLEQNRSDFETKFGEPLEWSERPGKKQKYLRIQLDDADPANRDDWNRQHA